MTDPDLFSGFLIFLLLAVVGGAGLSFTKHHRETLRLQLKLFGCAFILRFAMSIWLYVLGLVNIIKDEDGTGWLSGLYWYHAWGAKRLGLFDLPSSLLGAFEGHHRGYAYMLGALFYTTDMPARLPAAALNCFFGSLTVVFAYRIARTLFSDWVAIRVGWWTCLFPSLIIWSAQTLKEPVIILLETVALYSCVRLKTSGFSIRHILLCVLSLILMVPFRFYAVYIAGASVVLSLLLPHIGKRKTSFAPALGVGALVVLFVFFSGTFAKDEARFEQFNNTKSVQKVRTDLAEGTGSGVKSDYDLNSSAGFAMATVVGGLHVLLAPFPWQLEGGSFRMALTIPELVVWWWLFFVGVLPGLRYTLKHQASDIQPLLFFLVGLLLLYSVVFGNIGLAYRQRAQLLPMLLTLGAVGLQQRSMRRTQSRMSRIPALANAEARTK